MRFQWWIGCAATLAAFVLVAGGAAADGSWIVAGSLEVVDELERRIEVEGHMLHVGPHAKIKLADDVPGTWSDVMDRDGEHVSALVRGGHRAAADEILTLVLEDAIEDGEE